MVGKEYKEYCGDKSRTRQENTGFWKRTAGAVGTEILSLKITETVVGKKRLEGMGKAILHRQVPIKNKGQKIQ